MEHLESLEVVLSQILIDIPVPNTAELLGLYGRVCIQFYYSISKSDTKSNNS